MLKMNEAVLVQGEVEAPLSLWEEMRKQGLPAESRTGCAFDILATWMHLKRFRSELLDSGIVDHINNVVKRDRRELFESALNCTVLQGFAERADALTERINSHPDLWDHEPSEGEGTLGWFMSELLRELDNYVLCTAALKFLIETGPLYAAQYERVQKHVDAARAACAYFDEDADNFFFLWPSVIGMLETYRTDLVEQDARVIATFMHLWKIKLEHDLLEELL